MFSAGRVRSSASGQGGYTIVEVMTVLMVTSALFISAVVMVGGRQNRVEFSQSVNDIKSVLQQRVNQVASGYYARTGALANVGCDGTGSAVTFTGTGRGQGESTGCIYMGQALAFGVTKSGRPQQQYVSITLAGKQKNDGRLDLANPKAIAPGSVAPYSNYPDASVSDGLLNGLTVQWMRSVTDSGSTNIGAFALLSSLGTMNGGALQTGAATLDIMPVPGYTPPQNPLRVNETAVIDAINSNLATIPEALKNPARGIQICFLSGGTQQSALISIGSGGGAVTVDSVIKNNTSCA